MILVFGPGQNGFCGQVLSKTKNPLEACKNGRSKGGILNVFFFKTYSKFRNGFLKLRFFGGKRTGHKKILQYFHGSIFLWLVRWSGRGSATGNNFLANPKKATKSYSRSRTVLSVRDCREKSEKETTKIFIKKKRPKEALFCNRKLRSF